MFAGAFAAPRKQGASASSSAALNFTRDVIDADRW
jgi:hypothetical protein